MVENSDVDEVNVRIARELAGRGRKEGVLSAGEDGLLSGITKTVLETAVLNTELDGHLG